MNMFLNSTVRNIKRIQQVISILLKYGFEDVVLSTNLRRFVSESWKLRNRPITEYTRWERIRMVMEELGPTFIKFAQILSNRPDLLPASLIQEFEKLQDNAPPFDADTAKEIIERETGKSLSDLFSYFDNEPLGSASIGQVHRARLLNGEDVVVKIQRPHAKKQIKTDLSLMQDFVNLTENFIKESGILNPKEILETFEKSIKNELDYRIEARNIANFRQAYEDENRLYIPKPYKALTSSKVLVMEYVSGCKITDKERLESWGLDAKEVVKTGMDVYLKQIFELGYFHADPHPGNVLVKTDGTIVLLDFGMVGKLTRSQRYAFGSFLASMAKADATGMAVNIRRFSKDSEIEDPKDLEADLSELTEDFILYGDEDVQMSDITVRLQKIIYKYHLSVSGSIFLILRALTILEGIARQLHKDFDLLPLVKPYGAKLLKEQLKFSNISSDLYLSSTQITSLLYNLPMELKYILKKTRTGKLLLNIELIGKELFIKNAHYLITRLNLTLLICTLVLGSSIITASAGEHLVRNAWGIPYISIVGYIIAFFLLMVLFIYRKRDKY